MLQIETFFKKSRVKRHLCVVRVSTLKNTQVMKNFKLFTIFFTAIVLMGACDRDDKKKPSHLDKIESARYYDREIFTGQDLKIYGKWKLFDISGGIKGNRHDLNFEYLEIKKYGIYGFIGGGRLLEFGKIALELQTTNAPFSKISLQKEVESSSSFFEDRVKYVEFRGKDTLLLNSPCCDRYNYHFKRVK